ncbi:MAG: hypothetical protein CMC15_16285 [Flavobacteriaceae bacterium]|nr:hypothetical protein [Flavobacteriaceae bacterium]
MSYNQIATPRAYTCYMQRMLANGWRESSHITAVRTDGATFSLTQGNLMDLFDMKPQRYIQIPAATDEFYIQIDTGMGTEAFGESNFIAIMGHNFALADCEFKVEVSDNSTFTGTLSDGSSAVSIVSDDDYSGHTKLINAAASGTNDEYINAAGNGWSLFTYNDSATTGNRYARITFRNPAGATTAFDTDVYIGAILYGEYHDFNTPVSIGAEYSKEFDGTQISTSVGGSEYANTTNFGAPMWAASPWMMNFDSTSVNTGATTSGRPYYFYDAVGRRNLSLDFNHALDTDLFPVNEYSSNTDENYDSADETTQFFNRILGKHAPVLFSIDNTSTNENDYGLYRLVNDFRAKQIATSRFNYKVNLRESW